MDNRTACIEANKQFAIMAEGTGLALQYIDVGVKSGDLTGDTMEIAWAKTLANTVTVLAYLVERSKP